MHQDVKGDLGEDLGPAEDLLECGPIVVFLANASLQEYPLHFDCRHYVLVCLSIHRQVLTGRRPQGDFGAQAVGGSWSWRANEAK